MYNLASPPPFLSLLLSVGIHRQRDDLKQDLSHHSDQQRRLVGQFFFLLVLQGARRRWRWTDSPLRVMKKNAEKSGSCIFHLLACDSTLGLGFV